MTSDQITSIIEAFDHTAEYFVWQGENATIDMDEDTRLQTYYESVILPDNIYGDEDYEKILALMHHTGDNWDDAESAVGDSYWVLTDKEATDASDEWQDTYIEDCILSEIPEHLQRYFDVDSFKDDMYEDRGANLSSYDGTEYEETVNGTTYYIYKR